MDTQKWLTKQEFNTFDHWIGQIHILKQVVVSLSPDGKETAEGQVIAELG